MSQTAPNNLTRLMHALSCGLHLPVRLEGTELIGFAMRLDDAPFGPMAVVHVPEGSRIRVMYLDPDELVFISSDDSLRFS